MVVFRFFYWYVAAVVFLVLLSFLRDDQGYWGAAFYLTAAPHPSKISRSWYNASFCFTALWEGHSSWRRVYRGGILLFKQVMFEKKYLNLFAWVYFFTGNKYIGNTMKTIVIIINMRNKRLCVAASLRILPLFSLQMCLLGVVRRGAFCYCRAWGLSKEAREGKTQVPFFVIKLSLSPLASKPVWNQAHHVNISACGIILKPCLYSRICLIFNWTSVNGIVTWGEVTHFWARDKWEPEIKSWHEVHGDFWPDIASCWVWYSNSLLFSLGSAQFVQPKPENSILAWAKPQLLFIC